MDEEGVELLRKVVEDACRMGYKACEAGESLDEVLEAMETWGSWVEKLLYFWVVYFLAYEFVHVLVFFLYL